MRRNKKKQNQQCQEQRSKESVKEMKRINKRHEKNETLISKTQKNISLSGSPNHEDRQTYHEKDFTLVLEHTMDMNENPFHFHYWLQKKLK